MALVVRECTQCRAKEFSSASAAGRRGICKECGGELIAFSGTQDPAARLSRHDAADRWATCNACEHFGTHQRGENVYDGCGLLKKPCKVDTLRLDKTWRGPPGRDCFQDVPAVGNASLPSHFPTLAAPYVTIDQLAADSQILFERVSHLPIHRVVGVPRSGMVPATILATLLGVPLFGIFEGQFQPLQTGLRLRKRRGKNRGITLVVEDSCASGFSVSEVRQQLGQADGLEFAAVYVTPGAQHQVDYHAKQLPLPHWFEWNMWDNPELIRGFRLASDMDGVICQDCPRRDDDDGGRYLSWMRGVRPIVYPRRYPLRAIVTARLEKYRGETEAWLKSHRVKYGRLIMGPWATKRERERSDIAGWKAEQVQRLRTKVFVESCPHQARSISKHWGGPVICPPAKTTFVAGEGPRWPDNLASQWSQR